MLMKIKQTVRRKETAIALDVYSDSSRARLLLKGRTRTIGGHQMRSRQLDLMAITAMN